MNKKYFAAAGILGMVMFFAGIYLNGQNIFKASKKTEVEKSAIKAEGKITVAVENAGNVTSGEVKIKSGENVLQALKESHNVVTKHYSFGDLVQSIDGVSATSDKFWIYYLNGKSATVGASQYLPKDGDRIEWKLEEAK